MKYVTIKNSPFVRSIFVTLAFVFVFMSNTAHGESLSTLQTVLNIFSLSDKIGESTKLYLRVTFVDNHSGVDDISFSDSMLVSGRKPLTEMSRGRYSVKALGSGDEILDTSYVTPQFREIIVDFSGEEPKASSVYSATVTETVYLDASELPRKISIVDQITGVEVAIFDVDKNLKLEEVVVEEVNDPLLLTVESPGNLYPEAEFSFGYKFGSIGTQRALYLKYFFEEEGGKVINVGKDSVVELAGKKSGAVEAKLPTFDSSKTLVLVGELLDSNKKPLGKPVSATLVLTVKTEDIDPIIRATDLSVIAPLQAKLNALVESYFNSRDLAFKNSADRGLASIPFELQLSKGRVRMVIRPGSFPEDTKLTMDLKDVNEIEGISAVTEGLPEGLELVNGNIIEMHANPPVTLKNSIDLNFEFEKNSIFGNWERGSIGVYNLVEEPTRRWVLIKPFSSEQFNDFTGVITVDAEVLNLDVGKMALFGKPVPVDSSKEVRVLIDKNSVFWKR